MSFVSCRFVLTIITVSVLSFNCIKAQSIQEFSEGAIANQLAAINPITLDLEQVTVVDAIERLQNITSAKGMPDFNVIYDLQSEEALENKTINLRLDNVHAKFAFDKILQAFGLIAIYDSYAVRLISAQGDNLRFITKRWQVPPSFFKELATQTAGDPDAINTVVEQRPIDILKQLGVPLPEGSTIIYLASSNFLEARAPMQSIDIIDQYILDAKQKEASQVSLRIKLITINEDELDQLGFDWRTGGLINLEGSSNIAGGATISETSNANLFDANSNVNATPTQGVTAGNRTITELNEFNAGLDNLVGDLNRVQNAQNTGGRAPGVLSYIDNIDTSEQVAVMLRGLSQAKSFDIMESPHVVVKSGQQGSFFKGTEIRYPTAYDQAEVSSTGSQTTINQDTGEVFNIIPSTFSVVPSHPTDFETQKLGVELSVEPTLSANNQLINLAINPQFYEFDGFLNFGERIHNTSYQDELYVDSDNDGIILVGENSQGVKVVIENVLGGVSNSIILFDSDSDGLIDGVESITNNIVATENGTTTNLAVTNSAGDVNNFKGVFIYFAFSGGAEFIDNNDGIGLPDSSEEGSGGGAIGGRLFDTIDLDQADDRLYQVAPIPDSPFSVLAELTFIYFVDTVNFTIYEATPNIIVQPVFSKTQLSTQVTVQSGETVLLGGVMQQNKLALDDSIPILGDIPLAGQLFDSAGDRTESKAVLIFIEAIAQDPLGNPVSP